jgi:hypothetical protein
LEILPVNDQEMTVLNAKAQVVSFQTATLVLSEVLVGQEEMQASISELVEAGHYLSALLANWHFVELEEAGHYFSALVANWHFVELEEAGHYFSALVANWHFVELEEAGDSLL